MRKQINILFAFASVLTASEALASNELAAQKNCFACHSVQQKIVGPAFKDVAAKYRDTEGAEEKLVNKVRGGSTGTWGPIPMPPNVNVNAAEAATLVRWVLQQR